MGRTEHQDDHEEGEEERGGKRIELSASQVAGAGAATLAAATAASYLNVYGTVIGAAGMAALSTLVSPLLQHWFSRSGEQARQLAGRAVGHTGAPFPDAPGAPVAPLPGGISETALLREVTGTGTLPEAPDATRAMEPTPLEGSAGARADVPGATAHMPVSEPDGSDTGGPGDGSRARRGGVRRGWRSVAVPALVVFVLAMLVILAFELFTGRSLTSWTRGADEATEPTLFGGTISAPPAEEGGDADPATTGGAPGGSDPQGEGGTSDAPEDPRPTGPAPGTPEGGGTEDGGTEASPEPTGPPVDGPEDPVEQAPGPGTGGQGGEEAVPAPEPPAPPEG